MIEKIIHAYMYDEKAWNAYGHNLHVKNFEAIKPLMNSSFISTFNRYHGFHDWMLESVRMEFSSTGLDVAFQLSDSVHNAYNLLFRQCSGFRVEGTDVASYKHPNQIQLISFEKRSEVFIGIASTNGLVFYLSCEIPIICLEAVSAP